MISKSTSTSIISVLLALVMVNFKSIQAVDSDNCVFDFYMKGYYRELDDWPYESFSWAHIEIETQDGDVESTDEEISEGWNHNYNNEDIDGDYNLKEIRIEFYAWGISYPTMEEKGGYIEIECGHEIKPYSGNIRIDVPVFEKVFDYSGSTRYAWSIKIHPGAFKCGQFKYNCIAQDVWPL